MPGGLDLAKKGRREQKMVKADHDDPDLSAGLPPGLAAAYFSDSSTTVAGATFRHPH